MGMETGVALFVMGNKSANQEGVIIATCSFIPGMLLHAQPSAPVGHSWPGCCCLSKLHHQSLALLPRAQGLPSSYLFTEDLLALGVVDTSCPAPVSEAFPVPII